MQSPPPHRQYPPPNPVTRAVHRRQVFWQIYLPLGAAVILILVTAAGVLLAGIAGNGEVSRWGDVSIIWLILPMLLLTFIAFMALAAIVYVLGQALRILPSYTRQVLEVVLLIGMQVRRGSDAVVEPFIRGHSTSASLRRLFRR